MKVHIFYCSSFPSESGGELLLTNNSIRTLQRRITAIIIMTKHVAFLCQATIENLLCSRKKWGGSELAQPGWPLLALSAMV